ncbi:MAG: carboxylate-amine ligase [Kribbellaceae bacterium]
MSGRRVGVEEELFLADPESGDLLPASTRTLRAGSGEAPLLQQELFLEQIETATKPCTTLSELDAELREGRRRAATDAETAGAAIAAVATPVQVVDAMMTQKRRYQRMAEHHGVTARENLICGTHVHVETADEDEAVTALDRIRPWLPVLLAVSANSPYWHGSDSGYASFRAQVVSRWPSAGPTEPFGTAAAYHRAVGELIRTTAALDVGMIYFDARLAARYPTLEIRIADVCAETDDTVLIAALARALVETTVRETADAPAWRAELLRAAGWQASRWGLSRDLVHPVRREPRPAAEVLDALLEYVGPALDRAGDTGTVQAVLDDLRIRGTGSVRQRAVFARRSSAADVVLDAIERTRATYDR